jgi:uracil phosphoribosyltransferase
MARHPEVPNLIVVAAMLATSLFDSRPVGTLKPFVILSVLRGGFGFASSLAMQINPTTKDTEVHKETTKTFVILSVVRGGFGFCQQLNQANHFNHQGHRGSQRNPQNLRDP